MSSADRLYWAKFKQKPVQSATIQPSNGAVKSGTGGSRQSVKTAVPPTLTQSDCQRLIQLIHGLGRVHIGGGVQVKSGTGGASSVDRSVALDTQLQSLKGDVQEMKRRLRRKMNKQKAEIAAVEATAERVQLEVAAVNHSVVRLSDRADNVDTEIDTLKADVAKLADICREALGRREPRAELRKSSPSVSPQPVELPHHVRPRRQSEFSRMVEQVLEEESVSVGDVENSLMQALNQQRLANQQKRTANESHLDRAYRPLPHTSPARKPPDTFMFPCDTSMTAPLSQLIFEDAVAAGGPPSGNNQMEQEDLALLRGLNGIK